MSQAKVRRREIHVADQLFYHLLRLFGIGVLLILAAIAVVVLRDALPALERFGAGFLVKNNWDPVNEDYGAAAFIFGTLLSSFLALLISVPISVGAALFLNEIAPKAIARPIGFLVQMLAAIPSVIYGLWGIFVLAPWLRTSVEPWLGKYLGFLPFFQGPPFGVGMLAAGFVLAIMITPTISAICKEVFASIPTSQREAALGLGATRWETIWIAVVRSSFSGILGAVILGLGRALGETMAVTMVIGNRADISWSLFMPGQTMASVIANEYAEASADVHRASLAAIGFSLLIVSLIINSIARLLVWNSERKAR